MKKLIAIALLLALAVAAGLTAWWWFDLRQRPTVITRNQAEIASLLEAAGWVSPGRTGPRLYMVSYRDCPGCEQFSAENLADLHQAQVDTRIIVIARPDLNGQAQSTPAERATVADLWLSRSWPRYERWMAAPAAAWTAEGIAPADGDMARTAVIEAGRGLVDRLTPLLKANGVSFEYPLLIWWSADGEMKTCACTTKASARALRRDLGVL
jgi:hypothetical protein